MKTNKKDSIVRFRLTMGEKHALKQQMKQAGFASFSYYIRFLIFRFGQQNEFEILPKESKTSEKIGEKIADLLQNELNMIGKNINQVVKKINHTHGIADLKPLIQELKKQQQQILELQQITVEQIKEHIYNSQLNSNHDR